MTCMKSRGRVLRDSTISMPRSEAAARALTGVTRPVCDNVPASTALPTTFSYSVISGP